MKPLTYQHKVLIILAALLLITVIGYLDYITGYKVAFSIFYLLPICLVTWYIGRESGLIMSIIGVLLWFSIEYISSPATDGILLYFWNALVRFGFFIIVTMLLSQVNMDLEIQKRLARIDFLTAIPNRHDFS